MLLVNRVDLGFLVSLIFQFLLSPPPPPYYQCHIITPNFVYVELLSWNYWPSRHTNNSQLFLLHNFPILFFPFFSIYFLYILLLPKVQTCLILSTSDYCRETTGQLQSTIRNLIDTSFAEAVDFTEEEDFFGEWEGGGGSTVWHWYFGGLSAAQNGPKDHCHSGGRASLRFGKYR